MGTMTDKLNAILSSKAAIKAAIQSKGVDNVGDVLSEYAGYINSIPSSPWTGHADVEGLTAIGWTAEDIAYYQQYGMNWNEEDDQYHKVPAENIALYGTVTAQTVKNYANILVYCPKIDTSAETDLSGMFQSCILLVAIPSLDLSSAQNTSSMFEGCLSLACVPPLNTSQVTNMSGMFNQCVSLTYAPQIDFSSAQNIYTMYANCTSLKYVSDISSPSITNMQGLFTACATLQSVFITMTNVTNAESITTACYSLQNVFISGLKSSIILQTSVLSKDSLLYIINNSAATSAITITLSAASYAKFNADPDVTAALDTKPLVSLAQASA